MENGERDVLGKGSKGLESKTAAGSIPGKKKRKSWLETELLRK